MALEVLETIATPHQRESIERDVLSGFLTSNVLAAALAAIDWPLLTVEQLATIFGFDKSRDNYGSGPIAVAVKYDLLPKATAMSAELLLRAVLAASPRPAPPRSRFSRYSETDLPTGAWLLDVLPNCLERLLQLLPSNVSTYPDACMEAAERLEAQRECGFTDRDEFIRIRDLLSAHPRLRWPVALEIARSDISNAAYRLVWGSDCIVVLARTDLDELIARANDADKMIGSLWFDLGVEVAFRYLEKAALTNTLATLAVGSDMTARKALIATRRREETARKWKHRGWNKKETERKKIDFDRDSVNTDILRAGIGQIRDESGKPALNWLVNFPGSTVVIPL